MRYCPNKKEIGGICMNLELFGMGCSLWPNSLCIIEIEKREQEKWPLSGKVQRKLAKARKIGYKDNIVCFVFDGRKTQGKG